MLPRLLILMITLALPLHAQEAKPPTEQASEPDMTLERLHAIITALDPDAQTNGSIWQLQIADTPVLIVTDAGNDRMRAIAPVREAEGLTPEDWERMMQSNFDAALDARYAVGKGMLWSVFIHPLSPLEKNQLISGIGQVVNLSTSYGTLYSGGALQFGGGDSNELQRELLDDLLKKGEEI